jgi:3-hydroxyacyl-CoA dehydrogenase/enoyl-CoA hydratase/3-hydroxybutyryl-CoA epimerase
MSVLTENAFLLLSDAIKIAQDSSKRLIIYNQERNFSVGADLKFLLFNAKAGNFKKIEDFIRLGQKVMQELKYANVPTIALANNLALGGGCELLLHSSIIIATPLLQAGLVETGIGLIPAWGGLKEMVLRSQGNHLLLIKLLDNILSANKTSSADYFAQAYQAEPIIVAGEQNMLQYAISLDMKNFSPKVKSKSIILEKVYILNRNLDNLDQHMIFILQQIQQLLQKKYLCEQDLLDAEVDIFMQLIQTELVMEKISKILHI